MNICDINSSDFNGSQLHEIQKLVGAYSECVSMIKDELCKFIDRCNKAAYQITCVFQTNDDSILRDINDYNFKYLVEDACNSTIATLLADRDKKLAELIKKYIARNAAKAAKKTTEKAKPRLATDLVPIV